MNPESLLQHLRQYLPLSPEEQAFLLERLQYKKVKRKQYLLQENEVCNHYHFVVSGCLRLYLVDEKGGEHILQFATENQWISDIGSFHTRKPSALCIDAYEPSEVWRISHKALIELYENHAVFDRIFRVLAENAFVELQERVLKNISSAAGDRYLDFCDRYPQLVHRLPQTQIASYLGITPEFLSKIRKKIAGQ